ncbi:MAG: 50S ribosomal protein L11 methyltransferase [Clostridia bacterium]
MTFIEITVYTNALGTEIVSGALFALGYTSQSIVDTREDVEKFLQDTAKNWDYADVDEFNLTDEAKVIVYINDTEKKDEAILDIERAIKNIRACSDLDIGSLRVTGVVRDDVDWVDNWKKYYKPSAIGNRFLICPNWEKPPETDRIKLTIDPGLAFGTGLHPTTRMCIELLEVAVKGNDDVIDLGSGSGILTVASKLLGAKSVYAIDIDENAVKATKNNVSLNEIDGDTVTVRYGDVLNDSAFFNEIAERSFDIAVANIVAGVIIPLSETAAALIKCNGFFVTSGIIMDRLKDVEIAISKNGFSIEAVKTDGDWAAILARKGG